MKRESRYLVLKNSDMDRCLTNEQRRQLNDIRAAVAISRIDAGKPELRVLVIESDWPEYEPTWEAIEKRMSL